MLSNIALNPSASCDIRHQSYMPKIIPSGPLSLAKLQYEWIVNNPDFVCLAITVAFKNLKSFELSGGIKLATEYEYEKRVLTKIRKRLCRNPRYWDKVLPLTNLRCYEYEHTSLFKSVASSQSPHHIHGILPVPRILAQRVINTDTGMLDQRLLKDISSINTVSSFLIEELRLEQADSWFYYIIKGKRANDIF